MKNKNEKNKQNNMKKDASHKRVSVIIAILFFIFIIVFDICLIASHDKSFSDTENRILQELPDLNSEKLADGKFMSQFEDFASDQFPARNGWIRAKLKIDCLLGKKTSNGVILGKHGYLFEETSLPDEDALFDTINSINTFADSHAKINTVMTLIPNATEILKEYLPSGIPVRDQKEDIERIISMLSDKINFVDVIDALNEEKGNAILYYKSDHHWTSFGAYTAFKKIAPALSINGLSSYKAYTVADDFSGTMASSSGAFDVKSDIEIYVAEKLPDYYVEYSEKSGKTASIYDSGSLNKKNKYEVFFAGNHPKTVITTTNETKRNLLLLKDSYANCFVQFLLPYFDSIVMIDARYYSDDIGSEIKRYNISDALILYNENTFVTDNSLSGVLLP